MGKLIDVVNFNADASCLPSEKWLKILSGGKESDFYKWLELYVTFDKKISLGVIGASLCDVVYYCPEAIDLIKSNKNIFNIIIRPFSHDNALLRSRDSFRLNLEYGVKVTKSYFDNTSSTFLPPEFMLLSEQIPVLSSFGFSSVLVNSSRLPDYMAKKIPETSFLVQGLKSSNLMCFPVSGRLTMKYLESIHSYKFSKINKLVENEHNPVLWRDGESIFLIPDGINREKEWLKSENVERGWIDDLSHGHIKNNDFYTYPAHSFLAWMEEFKMFGYINRINALEKNIKKFNLEETLLWLQVINSDVLSSIEKKDVCIDLVNYSNKESTKFTIQRTHRGYEGEEFIYILEDVLLNNRTYLEEFLNELSPHALKYIARYKVLKEVN